MPVTRLSSIRSVRGTHFTEAIAKNGSEQENLTGLVSNRIIITEVTIIADQPLHYLLQFFSKDTFAQSNLVDDKFVGSVDVNVPILGKIIRLPDFNDWITDKGWESGQFGTTGVSGEWWREGTGAAPSIVGPESYAGVDYSPRTGNYNCRFATPSGTTQWGRTTYRITDPTLLDLLAGQSLRYSVYSLSNVVFSASDANNIRRIEVGDNLALANVSKATKDLPRTPYSVYQLVSATHTIRADPTNVFFSIYYYKAGARGIYYIGIDDMNVELIGTDGNPIEGPSMYVMNLKDLNIPYVDLDGTKELHALLKNLSPTSKSAGASGDVVIEVSYEPAA